MIRMFYCMRRLPSTTFEEFSAYWHGPHADIVRRYAQTLGIVCYVQHHAVIPEAAVGLQAARGLQEPFDGVAEIGFDSLQSMAAADDAPGIGQARADLGADEDRFIDRSRSVIFFAEDKIVI